MTVKDYKDTWTEDMECSLLVGYLDELKMQGKIKLFSHIAQETYTPYPSVKAKNKKMGVKPGVPDYLIVGWDNLFFLEMKRRKNGKVSKEQEEWLDTLSCYVFADVAYGFDEAKELIEKFLL